MKNNRIIKRKQNKRKVRLIRLKDISEIKMTDNFALPFTQSTVATVQNCGNVAQGTSFNQRVGIWINVQKIEVRIDLFVGAALIGSKDGHLRYVVVRDLQQGAGVIPTVTDVVNPFTPLGVRNVYFMKRFQILDDFLVRFSTYDPVKKIVKTYNINDKMGFSGGAFSDNSYRGVYLMLVSDNTANPPTIGLTTRIFFSDP